MSGPGITNFPDGMIAAGRTKATVVMGDHIPIGDSEDGNKVKVAPMSAVKAAATSDVVKLIGNQSIGGTKTFTTSPMLPTPTAGDNTTKGATTAFVTGALASKANDADVVKLTGNQSIGGTKTFTTSPVLPTPTAGDNTTKGATTAFVTGALASKANDADVVKLTGNQSIGGTKTFTASPVMPTPTAGDNSNKGATTAFVTGALAGASGIPAGVICMWSGTIATVPSGWALCDGTNGTPDLVDRFVVAAGSKAGGDKYDPGDTGGLDSVTLALTQIPSHQHSGTTGGGGAHTHVVGVPFWSGQSGGVSMIDKRDAARDDPAFSAAASVQPAPDHTHSFWTNYQGGGGSHENRPPYYALAFIMKL